jgi:hypothetical protein
MSKYFPKGIDIKDGLHYPYKNYSEEGQYAPTCQVTASNKTTSKVESIL